MSASAMLAILYIFAMSGLYLAVERYAPMPRLAAQSQDVISALFMLGCFVMGGAIGWWLPETLAHFLGWSWAGGPLERAAQVFGALAGLMIAIRGMVIWAVLWGLVVVGYLLMLLIGYIFGVRLG